MENYASQLRTAIENLINVKLHDALFHPDGLDRLAAHRSTGVASSAILRAEAELEAVIAAIVPTPKPTMSRMSLH
ncbi:MAG TPA: hypothetical protein VKK61_10735 [Tepidisphaeraceae bacterium]|nr:hypothetical protein [Tepidisphaeraceae bacterium]